MAFIGMFFVGIALLFFVFGIAGLVIGVVLGIVNATKAKNGIGKSRALSVAGMVLLIVGAISLAPLILIVGYIIFNSLVR